MSLPAEEEFEALSTVVVSRMESMLTAAQNMDWEEANACLAQLDKSIALGESDSLHLLRALVAPARELTLGLMAQGRAQNLEDEDRALSHFSRAKEALKELTLKAPRVAEKPEWIQLGASLHISFLSSQASLAKGRGDIKESDRLIEIRNHHFQEFAYSLPNDSPQRNFILGTIENGKALDKFRIGLRATSEMNLEVGGQYLRESLESFQRAESFLSRSGLASLLEQTVGWVTKGFGLLVDAQTTYVATLTTAIKGDVTKGDVLRLAGAERDALEGRELIVRAVKAGGSYFHNLDVTPWVEAMTQLIRNLRTLCEQSLTPKQLSVVAFPRVVFYFMGTFIVLVGMMKLTGDSERIGLPSTAFILVVSLVVALIGGLGFEALRMLPFFDKLLLFTPGHKKQPSRIQKSPKGVSGSKHA